jgi:hypothetical protein
MDTQITITASAAIPPTPENGETDEERQAREAREQKARDERRWALTRMIEAHIERLCVCLDMLVDSDVKDRATLAALAQRMRAEFMAALELTPEHKELGGSHYEISRKPFEHLYK